MKTTIKREVNHWGEMRCSIAIGGYPPITVRRDAVISNLKKPKLKPAVVNWFATESKDNALLSWFISAMRYAQGVAKDMNAGIYTAHPEQKIDL